MDLAVYHTMDATIYDSVYSTTLGLDRYQQKAFEKARTRVSHLAHGLKLQKFYLFMDCVFNYIPIITTYYYLKFKEYYMNQKVEPYPLLYQSRDFLRQHV